MVVHKRLLSPSNRCLKKIQAGFFEIPEGMTRSSSHVLTEGPWASTDSAQEACRAEEFFPRHFVIPVGAVNEGVVTMGEDGESLAVGGVGKGLFQPGHPCERGFSGLTGEAMT